MYWPRVYSISQWWNLYEKERASPPGQFIALQAIKRSKGQFRVRFWGYAPITYLAISRAEKQWWYSPVDLLGCCVNSCASVNPLHLPWNLKTFWQNCVRNRHCGCTPSTSTCWSCDPDVVDIRMIPVYPLSMLEPPETPLQPLRLHRRRRSLWILGERRWETFTSIPYIFYALYKRTNCLILGEKII